MTESRVQLVQDYYTRAFGEAARKLALDYLEFAEIVGELPQRTIQIVREVFAENDGSRTLERVLAEHGLDAGLLPAGYGFEDVLALISGGLCKT